MEHFSVGTLHDTIVAYKKANEKRLPRKLILGKKERRDMDFWACDSYPTMPMSKDYQPPEQGFSIFEDLMVSLFPFVEVEWADVESVCRAE
mgnify:FL=1